MKIAKASLAVLAIQLMLVSLIAAKYWYQRSHCWRVWTRTAMYDPSLILRGRYLSMTLTVDGCQSTLPSAKQAEFPRNVNGVPNGEDFSVAAQQVVFPAKLVVKSNKLVAIRIPEGDETPEGQNVFANSGAPCEQMRLANPVNFYIAENAQTPWWPTRAGQELWVEVTVPPAGPPRPIQLALKENGMWKPLAFQ